MVQPKPHDLPTSVCGPPLPDVGSDPAVSGVRVSTDSTKPLDQFLCVTSPTTMASTGPSSPGQYPGSRASLAASTQSQWDLNSSIYSDDTGKDAAGAATGNKTRKPRWVGQVKRWLSVSEPSAQAMKEQKVSTYKRYGIDLDDPRAAAKMHFPIGKVPEGATTSTGGPNPEKVHKEQTRQKQARNSCMALSRGSQSINSNISSAASMREAKQLVPWGS